MGFVRSEERNSLKFMGTGEFYDMERLTVFFETKPEVVRRLLPPPLKPASLPIGTVFVANYPKTNFGVTYLESALFLRPSSMAKKAPTVLVCLSPTTWRWS